MAAKTVDESNEERKRELEEARRGLEAAMARCAAAELACSAGGSAATLDGGAPMWPPPAGAAKRVDNSDSNPLRPPTLESIKRSPDITGARDALDRKNPGGASVPLHFFGSQVAGKLLDMALATWSTTSTSWQTARRCRSIGCLELGNCSSTPSVVAALPERKWRSAWDFVNRLSIEDDAETRQALVPRSARPRALDEIDHLMTPPV